MTLCERANSNQKLTKGSKDVTLTPEQILNRQTHYTYQGQYRTGYIEFSWCLPLPF